MLRILIVLLFCVPTAIFSTVRAEVYQPHSPWNIDYGKASCDLKRIFKSETNQVQLQITQSFDLGGASFYLVMKPADKKRYWETEVNFSIDETGAKLRANGQFLRIRDENLLVLQIHGFEINFLENLPIDATLRLKAKRHPEIALKLTGMNAVDDALKQCQRNLYEAFGVDYNQVELLQRQPRPSRNPGRWVEAIDYPTEALKKNWEGTVRFMLHIDARGQPEKCTILESSGHQSLDDHACKMLRKRARFVPALNKDGLPVKSNWISAVRWHIPR